MKNAGFTVLETIISIAVASLAIAGAMSAVRTNIVGASTAKEEVQAFYLAQDAIEYIRNVRDSNKLKQLSGDLTVNWLSGIADSAGDACYPPKTCIIDSTYSSNYTAQCSSGWGSCQALRQDPNIYIYGYNPAWPASVFKREIQIERPNASEAIITISISWSHGVTLRQFKTKTTLNDWL